MSAEVTVFAETNFRNQRRKFGIKRDDRRRHMYVVGKTGMGKSTLLENMIIADIRAGNGLAVVDPHGDLAEKILEYIPNNRVNDVIYFNPSDTKYPIAFNILESIGDDYKHLVAYGLVGVFKKIWADSWGPRMEYIMTNTILALLEYPGSTLLGLMRMLVDKAYRKKVVAKIQDPVVKTFWAEEYANYSEKFRTEAIAPIQNKVGQFLASAIIRNIVGQSKSTIEMRDIMDKQKILIMNLSKGRIGEENSALLGAMMITKLQIAAMSRVDIPESERKDFYLYVDEFQNFATDSFASILSEARKYRLCLIMAHQYFEQLGDVVKAAVFGNVGTMIVFRVGAADAAELELEFAPQFLPADIVNLKKYSFCLRLMVDGVATEPFSGIGLPPAEGKTNNRDKLIKVSRERYARPQELVEDRIIRWSGVEINRPGTATEGDVSDTDVDTTDDQGDDMNWPEPVWKTDEQTEELTETASAAVATHGIKMESANDAPSAFVAAANFIPGDHTTPTPKAATVEVAASAEPVKPVQPIVKLEPEPEIEPEPVQPEPVRVAPEVPAATSSNESTRPRITFVNRKPSVQTEPVVSPSTAQPQSVPLQPKPQPAEPVVMPTLTKQPVAKPVAQVTVPKPARPLVEQKPTVMPVEHDEVKDNDTDEDDEDTSTGSSVSLHDLKQGNVQSVKFSPSQPAGQQNANGVQTGDGKKRKRKRKRKRGGSGAGNGQPQSTPVQTMNSSQLPKPVQQPKPAVQPVERPQLQQPKPQPKPAPSQPSSNQDANKVQWGDLL